MTTFELGQVVEVKLNTEEDFDFARVCLVTKDGNHIYDLKNKEIRCFYYIPHPKDKVFVRVKSDFNKCGACLYRTCVGVIHAERDDGTYRVQLIDDTYIIAEINSIKPYSKIKEGFSWKDREVIFIIQNIITKEEIREKDLYKAEKLLEQKNTVDTNWILLCRVV